MFTFILTLLSCFIVYAVVSYLLDTVPMFLFARRFGYDYAWLVWIPCCRWFVLVKISELDGSNTLRIGGLVFNRNIAAWGTILVGLLSFIPVVGNILSAVVVSLIVGASCRDLYARADNKSTEETCVLGYFSGFFRIIFLAKLYQYLYLLRGVDNA